MATRAFLNSPDPQNGGQGEYDKLFDGVMMFEYQSPSEETYFVGANLFGQDDLGIANDGRKTRQLFISTDLVGRADLKSDTHRQEFSSAGYYTGSLTIRGLAQMGKVHYYYDEDQQDRPEEFRFAMRHIASLPKLLKRTEEYQRLLFYVNGETQTGGFAKTPLFCDGVNSKLQLVGRSTYFSGTAASNIIDWFGGVGYAMIMMADSYGDNFVNEEGERAQTFVTDVLTGSYAQGDLLYAYYTSRYNIDTANVNVPNPRNMVQGNGRRRVVPNIWVSDELASANPLDVIFFYDGWKDDIKEVTVFAGKTDTWTEGNAQMRRTVSQVRTRRGHYNKNNRRVLLMRGAVVN